MKRAPDAVTTLIIGAGSSITAWGVWSLGRSFGVVPANRGVVSSGIYRYIRHPLYAGYLLAHIGLVLAHPAAWNVVVWILGDSAQIGRLLKEERLLDADAEYRQYQQRVPWRLVPGVI